MAWNRDQMAAAGEGRHLKVFATIKQMGGA